MVGAGAKILGSFEVGDNASIGANSVLLKPLESDSTAVGIPARPVKLNGQAVEKKHKLAQVNADISKLAETIDILNERLSQMEELLKKNGIDTSSLEGKRDTTEFTDWVI